MEQKYQNEYKAVSKIKSIIIKYKEALNKIKNDKNIQDRLNVTTYIMKIEEYEENYNKLLYDISTKIVQLSLQPKPIKKDIVIVGAGPVGLVLALLLSQQFVYNKIYILEKHIEFTRPQITMLRQPSLTLLKTIDGFQEKRKKMIEELCWIRLPSEDIQGKCYENNDGRVQFKSIQISHLQNILLNFIKNNRKTITLINTSKFELTLDGILEVELIEGGMESLEPYIIFGCDGTNSTVRTQLMPKNNSGTTKWYPNKMPKICSSENRINVCYDKRNTNYKWDGINQRTYGYTHFFKEKQLTPPEGRGDNIRLPTQHRYRYFKGYEYNNDDGTPNIYLSYLGIQLYPDELNDENLIEKLNTAMLSAMIYYDIKPEMVEAHDVIITSKIFPITYEKVLSITDNTKNTHICLIGDSAQSVNFFSGTGIENGFHMVTELMSSIKEYNNVPFETIPKLYEILEKYEKEVITKGSFPITAANTNVINASKFKHDDYDKHEKKIIDNINMPKELKKRLKNIKKFDSYEYDRIISTMGIV
jgi:2-polyprenyl-6-methoxyphenol hydroxylase-like FAD-dependent oxidoreductase